MIYMDWADLKKGAHVRLACGCQGFIENVVPHSADETERGFMMVYTIMGCVERKGQRDAYRNGYGPYKNMFNYDLGDNAMPAEDVVPPPWFQSLDIGPRRGAKKKWNLQCPYCTHVGYLIVKSVFLVATGIQIFPNADLLENGFLLAGIAPKDVPPNGDLSTTGEAVQCRFCSWSGSLKQLDITPFLPEMATPDPRKHSNVGLVNMQFEEED